MSQGNDVDDNSTLNQDENGEEDTHNFNDSLVQPTIPSAIFLTQNDPMMNPMNAASYIRLSSQPNHEHMVNV